MRRLLFFLILCLPVSAQISSKGVLFVPTDPSGACSNGSPLRYNFNNGALWGCDSGTWTAITGGGGGGGTVTSVGLALPNIFSISGSPVTTSGTLTGTFATEAANTVLSGPTTGAAAAPTFRALVTADMPAGTGTVTSIGTTSPITGGTITTTGTIACATCATTTNGGALSATAPETISAAGVIACATCATTTNGGALSATSPVTISAAGVIACSTCNTSAATVTSFSAGTLSPLFTTSVATATTTPALTFALSNAATLTHLSGPNAYGAAAAAPTYRTFVAQDIPATYGSCDGINTGICTASVDASGNPNFLTTAANTVLPINGGTTSLIMFIGGIYQVLNTNVTLTVPSTASVPQWILAVQDTTNANMVAGDFLAMNTAPAYAYTAPTCPSPSPALSSTNPAYWFDLSTNLSKTCTSNGGAYSANPSVVIGVVWVDATPKVLAVAMNPLRLNPYKRFELFGNGTDGTLTITSGTTTIDVHKQYASVIISAGTLVHTLAATNLASIGVSLQSQNPVLIFGTGSVNVNALGNAGGAGATGAGAAGASGANGGTGGGGGGSGTVSAAGGAGGARPQWLRPLNAVSAGTAGGATPTAGGNGVAAYAISQAVAMNYTCAGSGGGSGAGDGTNVGGGGGKGGGSIWIKAPSIVVDTGGTVSANGGNGSNSAGGNGAGGGGGGGGCAVLSGVYINTANGTFTASAGTHGNGSGTGTNGGDGGAGLAQSNKMW